MRFSLSPSVSTVISGLAFFQTLFTFLVYMNPDPSCSVNHIRFWKLWRRIKKGTVRGFLYRGFLFILWLFFFLSFGYNCNALIVIIQPSLFKHYNNVGLWLKDLGCIWGCGENVMNIFVFIIKLYRRCAWEPSAFRIILLSSDHCSIFIWLSICIKCEGGDFLLNRNIFHGHLFSPSKNQK